MTTKTLSTAELSREKMLLKVKQRGYVVSPTQKQGNSSAYWIVYAANPKKENKV